MPILHHHPLSAGSRYVRLVLAEFGEAVELVERHPLERDDEFLALNPAEPCRFWSTTPTA